MGKSDYQKFEGQVENVLPNGFKITLDAGPEIIAHISGRIRKSRIKVLIGDRVVVEISRYDTTKGRIVQRLNASR